jgi:RNA polymerase sporulation-specific sigma factor
MMSRRIELSAARRDLLSLVEAKQRIDNLDDGEMAALVLHAGALAMKSRLAANDIFGEAVVAVLEGRRHWPADLETLPFLKGVMDSVCSNDQKKAARLHLVR